jgi:hypothetical protein
MSEKKVGLGGGGSGREHWRRHHRKVSEMDNR